MYAVPRYVKGTAECNHSCDSYSSEGLAMQALPFMKCISRFCIRIKVVIS